VNINSCACCTILKLLTHWLSELTSPGMDLENFGLFSCVCLAIGEILRDNEMDPIYQVLLFLTTQLLVVFVMVNTYDSDRFSGEDMRGPGRFWSAYQKQQG